MPARSSHLLQPLDVGCSGPLKRAYGRLVEQKTRSVYNHIDKFDFLKAHPAAQEVLKPLNIQNGFAAAGIYPFDPKWCLRSYINICVSRSLHPLHKDIESPARDFSAMETRRELTIGVSCGTPATRVVYYDTSNPCI
jgi:hypothetical protein